MKSDTGGVDEAEALLTILFPGTGAADWPRTYEAAGITDLLVTHTHGDHLEGEALERLLEARDDAAPLRVWLEAGGLERLPELEGIEVHALESGQTFEPGQIGQSGQDDQPGDLMVTALAANHVVQPPEQPLHYLIESHGRAVLYATDGAWLRRETWLRLRDRHLDGLIWDATNGETEGDWRIFEHNSVDMIRLMLQTLRREEMATAATRVLLTHMARTLCAPHSEMLQRLAPEGIEVASDGLLATWPPATSTGTL